MKGAEKSLEEVKGELEQAQKALEAEQTEKAAERESHQSELEKRSEAYGVVQERNQELENKLNQASQENSQLAQ